MEKMQKWEIELEKEEMKNDDENEMAHQRHIEMLKNEKERVRHQRR